MPMTSRNRTLCAPRRRNRGVCLWWSPRSGAGRGHRGRWVDASFPAGIYEVIFVTHHVGMRGPTGTVCDVKWLSSIPSRYDEEAGS